MMIMYFLILKVLIKSQTVQNLRRRDTKFDFFKRRVDYGPLLRKFLSPKVAALTG